MSAEILTFVVTSKGRLQYLKRSLPLMSSQPYSKTIVVDYSCPERTCDWVDKNYPQVVVIKHEDKGSFNLARARNLGLNAVRTDWVAFIDADVLLDINFMNEFKAMFHKGYFYNFEEGKRKKGINGSCIVPTRIAVELDGYDEAFQGWGPEDKDFYWRLSRGGLRRDVLKKGYIDCVIEHSNEIRTIFYDEKELHRSQTAAAIYLQVKQIYIEQGIKEIEFVKFRIELFNLIKQKIFSHIGREQIVELKIPLPSKLIKFHYAHVEKYLLFKIKVRNFSAY